ncbi:unnamed protein product [Adineta ricciae]|uniref:Uncharacterized protein n=1 Tax=Adineta ricciae TaxID=249248 RepID=A0A814CNF5_ADIRI|nr:unnamed protein product [Adineta ricciae]
MTWSIYIVGILLLSSQDVQGRLYLYYMDQTINNETEKVYNEETKGEVLTTFTFEELRRQQVTTFDLLSWSALIDLVELYDEYLDGPSNVSLRFQKFYNCSVLWFGRFCQYTFNISLPLNIIVNKTFTDKRFTNKSDITCYLHLDCDRGPAPACFDWREICDRKVDCLGNDADEKNCFELEINECKENEYRCHNGMCIPEEFLNEGYYYSDCIDGTDENILYAQRHAKCSRDPGFWCEESTYRKNPQNFVCGDGDVSDDSILEGSRYCDNRRNVIIKSSLFSYVKHSALSYNCWFLLLCTMADNLYLKDDFNYYNIPKCTTLCDNDGGEGCNIRMVDECHTEFVVFPQRPILHGHVSLVYLTNQTIFFNYGEINIFPDYVCYDARKCPFLPSNSILSINGTTCQSTQELNLYTFTDIINLFQSCLIVIENEHEMNYNRSTLFQCPGTTKYISTHRVFDGVPDCYKGADEKDVDACQWNHKHRFKCSTEQKCISFILFQNGVKDCRNGDDEIMSISQQITFQNLCNGYVHLQPITIDEFIETDETHCDDWPCNNLYTRCDGAWNCPNGIDELNCSPSTCPPDTHECISPITKKVICLPYYLAGNGIIDCLGSTDEREYCRLQKPERFQVRFKCWNDTLCVHNIHVCLERICFMEGKIDCSSDMEYVLKRLDEDRKLKFPLYKYFMLDRLRTNLSSLMVTKNDSIQLIVDQETMVSNKKFTIKRTETCHRGILIYIGISLKIHCLCPPSYYGNRCQYQSQRVSLTLQFSRKCTPVCYGVFGIIISLIDQDNVIHAYEQLTYASTYECNKKYFTYLLYQSRPKNLTKKYKVKIDAYNKINLTYYASWILPVQFLFLPVNRIAAYFIIPAHPINSLENCSVFCGYGRCYAYVNSPNEYFCVCNSGWSGINCTISDKCNCSADSKCLGKSNNQSMCLCPVEKYGSHCRLQSICQNQTCKNGGQCISENERVSRNSFICLCPIGFSGPTCETIQTKVHISFIDIEIPRSLFVHFITVQTEHDPIRTTINVKIPFDQNQAIVQISISFHIIIVQISKEYFLTYVSANNTSSSVSIVQTKMEQRCLNVLQLFHNETVAKYSLLRRVKYYHLLCRDKQQLKCFYDEEAFMCLCNEEGYANCFSFDFNVKYTCKRYGDCQNNAQCFSDRPNCPLSTFCVCEDCFYGSKCQFTTKGFDFSLDAILGYQIRPHLSVNHQPTIVKITIVLTTIMVVIGFVNSILSIITFQRKIKDESGCRHYLLATSIVSLFSTFIFSIKFFMLILSQMSIITNITILRISCILIDFLLRLIPTIIDWLNASIGIDRALALVMSIKYDKNKSRRAVKWTIISILIFTTTSILHDPINRQLIEDEEENRRWCLIQYSPPLQIYNSAINIFHFLVPFIINLVTAITIIFVAARSRATAHQQQTYQQHLNEQFHRHNHLIVSAMLLVVLATPRLIISFISGCMKSVRYPALYLFGYFISYIPPSLTFIVFVVPSKSYKTEFYAATKRFRTVILGRQWNVT